MYDPKTSPVPLPPFAEILASNPGWLDEAVNETEAARIIGGSVATLQTQRVRGGPDAIPFLKLGKSVRYRRRVLFEHLLARERRTTSDPGPGSVIAEAAP